jgi:hypothetical protein
MASKYLEVTGPLFSPDVAREFNKAVNAGLEELGDEAAGILAGFVSQGGFEKTGAFLRSIDSKLTSQGGEVGFVKVAPTDVWPTPNRPTRTWFESGVRGGKKLRKGIGGFSKTTTRVNGMSYDKIESKIAGVLN